MVGQQFDKLGQVIDRLDDEFTYYPYQGEVNQDGYANISFGAADTVRGLVRPNAAMDFEIGSHGREDEDTLYFLVRDQYGVTEHDRLIVEGEPRRAVEREQEYLNAFSLFRLIPDGRGGTDEEDNDEDTNPFEPV